MPAGGDWRQDEPAALPSLHLLVAVDDDVAEEVQELGRPVPPRLEPEEGGRGVDQGRVGLAGTEGLVVNDIFNERNVGLYPPDPHFPESPVHPLQGRLEVAGAGGQLDQQRIIKGGDHGTGIAHRPVEADAKSGGRAVADDFSVVRGEVVFRVLGGDARLHGVAAAAYLVLGGDSDFLPMQLVALRDEDHRAHDVDSGHDLGHRVLYLDARVHLDEKPFPAVHIEEELDGPGTLVPDLLRDAHGRRTKLAPGLFRQVDRGGYLDHLLVASLDRTVALVQVNHVAVFVPEDLHLDVLGPADVALEEDTGISEGALRLALGLGQEML